MYVVFDDIHNMIDAVNKEALDGIIMNRYSATYYMRKHQESSLFVAKRLQHEFNLGFILTNRRKDCFQMFSECVQRSYESVILPQVKLLTAKYEVIGSKGSVLLLLIIIKMKLELCPKLFTNISIAEAELEKISAKTFTHKV